MPKAVKPQRTQPSCDQRFDRPVGPPFGFLSKPILTFQVEYLRPGQAVLRASAGDSKTSSLTIVEDKEPTSVKASRIHTAHRLAHQLIDVRGTLP